MAENPMVAVVREELRKKEAYAAQCEATVRSVQRELETIAQVRDRADKDVDATRKALAVLEAMGDNDE